jgi:ATPase subunit of ABC transporter with duplicated ATPase domains
MDGLRSNRAHWLQQKEEQKIQLQQQQQNQKNQQNQAKLSGNVPRSESGGMPMLGGGVAPIAQSVVSHFKKIRDKIREEREKCFRV